MSEATSAKVAETVERGLLREIDEYLSGHKQNAIYCGSKLHQDIKRALLSDPASQVGRMRQALLTEEQREALEAAISALSDRMTYRAYAHNEDTHAEVCLMRDQIDTLRALAISPPVKCERCGGSGDHCPDINCELSCESCNGTGERPDCSPAEKCEFRCDGGWLYGYGGVKKAPCPDCSQPKAATPDPTLKSAIEQAVAWLASPEGAAELSKNTKAAQELAEQLRATRIIPWEKLHAPFTI